uniref:Uncharacterized protein n=1 Tax=Anguilla anguilla TaxID=7936 RepID=A0A0E9S9K0_ANGAN
MRHFLFFKFTEFLFPFHVETRGNVHTVHSTS